MAQYCDSKILEANWFNWLVTAETPALDEYRARGILLTKVLGQVLVPTKSGGKKFPDPLHPVRSHCIATRTPLYFNSYHSRLGRPTVFEGSRPIPRKGIPPAASIALHEPTLSRMTAKGYRTERPSTESWQAMTIDIEKMCRGIASKFNLPPDAKADLASDALLLVMEKIKSRRLTFTPGRAPVFNLLTTTIHRVIFSILNRDNRTKQKLADVVGQVRYLSAGGCRRPKGKRIVSRRMAGSLLTSTR